VRLIPERAHDGAGPCSPGRSVEQVVCVHDGGRMVEEGEMAARAGRRGGLEEEPTSSA
jgi:hypothetical protein